MYQVACHPDAATVVTGIVGCAGLKVNPTHFLLPDLYTISPSCLNLFVFFHVCINMKYVKIVILSNIFFLLLFSLNSQLWLQ